MENRITALGRSGLFAALGVSALLVILASIAASRHEVSFVAALTGLVEEFFEGLLFVVLFFCVPPLLPSLLFTIPVVLILRKSACAPSSNLWKCFRP